MSHSNNNSSTSTSTNNNSDSTASSKTSHKNDSLVPKRVAPCFPPLYFAQLPVSTSGCSRSTLAQLPTELWSKSLLEYADWGDLARLSAVCRLFRNVVQDAAQAGGHDAQWSLANAYLEGDCGLAKQPHRAVDYLTHLAGFDDDAAQYLLLLTTEENDDEQQHEEETCDNDASFALVSSSSSSLYFAPAMTKLADYYLEQPACDNNNNEDDDEDQDESAENTIDNSNDDNAETTTAHDPNKPPLNWGLVWLHAAYRYGGDLNAAFRLASIYEEGSYGTPVDIVAATSWFRRAAVRGHVEAMAEYALCLELGSGLERPQTEESVSWYVRAANAGHVHAASCVGEAFEEGKGVPQSHLEACRWYFRAAQGGDEESQQVLEGRLQDVARILLPTLRGQEQEGRVFDA